MPSGQLRLVPSRPCWYPDFMSIESCRNPALSARIEAQGYCVHPGSGDLLSARGGHSRSPRAPMQQVHPDCIAEWRAA